MILTKGFRRELRSNILNLIYDLKGFEIGIEQELLIKQIAEKQLKSLGLEEIEIEYAKEILKALNKLENEGFIEYAINSGQKVEYKLTRKGFLHCENKDKIIPIFDKKAYKINPALDYIDRAFIGIFFPCKDQDEEKDYLCLVTDFCEIFPVTKESLKRRDIRITNYPAEIEQRWSSDSIDSFINNEVEIKPLEVFNAVKKQYQKYIDFPEKEAYDFFSLWVIGTYLHPLLLSYPYVYLGGIKESGKTKVLHVTSCLAFNSIFSGNMTASSLFRLIQNNRCTLLIDETEKLSNPERAMEFRTILLNGYKSGSKVYRVESDRKKQFRVIPFEPYSPKMLANILGLEDVLESRCISFILKRTLNREIGNREVNDRDLEWQEVRDLLYVFALKFWKEIKSIYYSLTNETDLNNRYWELWKPIFSIARFIDESLYNEMKVLADRKSEEQKIENVTETGEYILVETLLELVDQDDFYKINEIKEKMLEQFEDVPTWLNNKWVGRALKRLGFSDKRRIGTGVEVRLKIDAIKDVAQRLQIIPTQTTQIPQITLGSLRTDDNQASSEVCVVSEVSEGLNANSGDNDES